MHHHAPRAGLGAAYVDAFSTVLDGGCDGFAEGVGWIVQMDADGSHAPEELPRLLAAARDADVVLGSRYVPGGGTEGWAWHRRLLSRAGNVYSRRALRLSLHDVTGGYRCFRRGALAEVGMATVASEGYCFQVDVAFRVQRAGLRVREVPITFVERAHGESKMSGAVVREALWRITSWAVRDRARRRRARRRADPALDRRKGRPGGCRNGPHDLVNAQALSERRSLSRPRRSSSSSSSSGTERRSSSMSQWVRGGLDFFCSGSVPSMRLPSSPWRRHSQVTGASASSENGTSKSWPLGQRYAKERRGARSWSRSVS